MMFQNPHHGRLLAELGIRGSKIPADFAVMLRGVALYADSIVKEPFALVNVTVRESNSGGTRRSRVTKHRVFVQCNDCMRWIPAGRLWQHGLGHTWFTIERHDAGLDGEVLKSSLLEEFGKMPYYKAKAVRRFLMNKVQNRLTFKVIECGRR